MSFSWLKTSKKPKNLFLSERGRLARRFQGFTVSVVFGLFYDFFGGVSVGFQLDVKNFDFKMVILKPICDL